MTDKDLNAEEAELKLRLKELRNEMTASDEMIVLNAIASIRSEGHIVLMPEVLVLLKDTDSTTVREGIKRLLFDLQDNDSAPAIAKALEDPAWSEQHRLLVASFWESKMDGSAYIDIFARLAVAGDYELAMECMTVTDNLEGPFAEEKVMEAMLPIKEFLSNQKDDPKADLIALMYDRLKTVYQQD